MLGLDQASPRAWAPFEAGVSSLIRQRGDEAEARTRMGDLVRAYGPPRPGLGHGLTHAFPDPEALADADDAEVRRYARAVLAGS
jgi:AraC family transcriptional regulator of adaptative response / DNA-3-methyladenine glycosylase II